MARHLRPIHRHPAPKHAAQAHPNSPPDPSTARQKSIHFQALSTSRDGQTIEVMLMVGSGKCPSEQHGRLSSATTA
jgi:hypothetical protein